MQGALPLTTNTMGVYISLTLATNAEGLHFTATYYHWEEVKSHFH